MGGSGSKYGGQERCIHDFGRETDKLGDPRIDGRIILSWIFKKLDERAWTRSNWVRIGTGGGYLWMR